MLRTTRLVTALTLISGSAQAGHQASTVATAAHTAAPGDATPGQPPPPAATPTPQAQPHKAQPVAAPQPYGPPLGSAPCQSPPQPPRRRGKGMMIAGFVTFSATYLIAAFNGAALLDTNRKFGGGADDRFRKLGTALMIPVVGPLIAIPHLESPRFDSISAVLNFVIQGGGLALGIIGAVRYSRDGRRIKAVQAGLHLGKGVRLGAAPRLGGATLNLSYRF